MKLNGSQIVAEILLEQGVDTIFGYPGGAALNLYDSLYEYGDRLRHILSAHEQGAAHAADGYARATGKTGVVFATSGPGATNLVTGIATAFMDSVPLVAITANVPEHLIGRDAFQEICITGVTMPITKHNYFVNRIEDLPGALRGAFRIANCGRKGPVLVDITKDVTGAVMDYRPAYMPDEPPIPKPIDPKLLKKIADLVNGAKRPVLYVGGGVCSSGAEDILDQFIEKADLPVGYTLMAAGVVGAENPRNLGLIGMHGTIASNRAIDRSDLLLALGTRFSDRVALNPSKFARRATRIQVDIDKSEINKNVLVDLSVVSDIKEFLFQLMPLIQEKQRSEWMEEVGELKKTTGDSKTPDATLHPSEIIGILCDNTDKETIYVTDVGQHQMWTAQYLKHNHTSKFITSGGLGTMGFGYGAAIGAQIGRPDRRVIHITGDGSFHMNMNEACTAVSQNLPIITVIMNNQVLGMVYQWQTTFYKGRYSQTSPGRKSDFVKLAEGFGAKAFRADTPESFRDAFLKSLKETGPVWIECVLSRNEKVLPMIPSGGTVEDMIIG